MGWGGVGRGWDRIREGHLKVMCNVLFCKLSDGYMGAPASIFFTLYIFFCICSTFNENFFTNYNVLTLNNVLKH